MPQLHYTIPANPTCKNCRHTLTAPAEPEAGQWIIRCFSSFRRTAQGLSPHTITFPRPHVRVGPDEQPLLYCRALNTSNIGTGPPLVTTVGITPFHFSIARP